MLTRRRLLTALGVLAPVGIAARPAWHLTRSYLDDRLPPEPWPVAGADASGLDREAVRSVKPAGSLAEIEQQLRETLAQARARGQRVSIAGARHSMGGHTRLPEQVQIDTSGLSLMELEPSGDLLRVQSGARFSDVLRYLDARGASVQVMQSNSDFSVGGSVSVNCHGWQPSFPPIAATVLSLRVMLADGSISTASREHEHELFSLVLGGYGLFGIVLDARLRVTRNQLLSRRTLEVGIADYAARFASETARANLAFGRLAVAPSVRFERALLTVYEPVADARELPPLTAAPEDLMARTIFRGQVGSDYGKELRWTAERWFGGEGEANGAVTRNQLLSEPVAIFQNRAPSRTDILQEYFVPSAKLDTFVSRARKLVDQHGADLLNVTIRNVHEDRDAFLRYARTDVFGLVMLFNIERTVAADQKLGKLARDLIDAAIDCGGTYYLPYRPYASPEQFVRAYPAAREFMAKKLSYDPARLFSNQWYERYCMGL